MAAGRGLRWGECVGLTWENVDLTQGYVHVTRSVIEISGRLAVLGRAQASTTLNRYTHRINDYDSTIRSVLDKSADFLLTLDPEGCPET